MRTHKKLLFLFGLLLSLNQQVLGALSEGSGDAPKLSPAITKVQDGIYAAQIEPGLWFVLEGQNAGRVGAWSQFHENQRACADEMVSRLAADSASYPVGLHGIIKGIGAGLIGFGYGVENFMKGISRQLWVAYAVHSDTCPSGPYASSPSNNVEMTVTIATDPDMPFTSHMGISRSATYLQSHFATPQAYPMHDRISILLHAFMGNVTHALMPDKPYMITFPMLAETRLIVESLPTEAVWLGDSFCYESGDPDMLTSVAKVGRESAAVQRVLDKKYSPIKYAGVSYKTYKGIRSGADDFYSKGYAYSVEDFGWQLFDGERLIWDVKAFDAAKTVAAERAHSLEWFLMTDFSAWHTGTGGSDALTVRLDALAAAFDTGLVARAEEKSKKLAGVSAATA